MHRSRLCAVVIDVPAESYEDSIAFWGGAIGKRDAKPDDDDPDFADLGSPAERLVLLVQRVGAQARIHLDVETDDVDAEAARLVALGATEVQRVRTWIVMQDPAGLLFCVVRPQSPDFPAGATEWQ
jgi:hypothetical protein